MISRARRVYITAILCTFGALYSCGHPDLTGPVSHVSSKPIFYESGRPEQLSAWNVFSIQDGKLTLNDRVVSYDLNSALFTDYAHKLRTVWLPEGSLASYDPEDIFQFPVGTIITKTFYYPRSQHSSIRDGRVTLESGDSAERLNEGFDLDRVHLIETRLLVKRDAGWEAFPYVWNEDQNEAALKRTGDFKFLNFEEEGGAVRNFTYVVPNANQCAGCHGTNATTRDITPIGPKARHLNRLYMYANGEQNQLHAWAELGILEDLTQDISVPKAAAWDDVNFPLNERARAYLDINCAHCHNTVGPADTSGLLLEHDAPLGPSFGLCKLPIAAGKGTGGRSYGIVPGSPEQSIFTYRMESEDPSIMMPELGRTLSHKEGVELIENWIMSLDGSCP
jgi:uncharacterized repeat protein (TIGR03806 family)